MQAQGIEETNCWKCIMEERAQSLERENVLGLMRVTQVEAIA